MSWLNDYPLAAMRVRVCGWHAPLRETARAMTGLPEKRPQAEVWRVLRCLIVDDSTAFLEAARKLLEQEGAVVVGVASGGDEAVRIAEEVRPDVTLVDIDLGDEDGIALAYRLAAIGGRPAGKLILISTHGEDEFADLIQGSPAIGFIAKSVLSVDAIRALTGDDPERAD